MKLLIETLRTWKPMMLLDTVETPPLMSSMPPLAISTSPNSIQEQKDRLVVQVIFFLNLSAK